MMRHVLFIVFIILFVFDRNYAQAQDQGSTTLEILDQITQEYGALFDSFNREPFGIETEKMLNKSGSWSHFLNEEFYVTSKLNPNNTYETSAYKNSFDPGISWVSNASYNFEPGFSDIEQLVFRSSISSGLDWNILGDGSLIKNKKSQKIFEKRLEREKLSEQLKQTPLLRNQLLRIVEKVFASKRLELLKSFNHLLEMRATYFKEMHSNGLINSLPLTQAKNEQKATLNKIHLAEAQISLFDSIDINAYKSILYDDEDPPSWQEINKSDLAKFEKEKLRLSEEIADFQTRSNREIRLRLNLRYNYYELYNNNNRGYGSVGASVSVPLFAGATSDREKKFEIAKRANDINNKKESLINSLQEDYIEFYKLKVQKLELIDRIAYSQSFLENEEITLSDYPNSFSPTKSLAEIIKLKKYQFELLDIQEELLKLWLRIMTQIPDSRYTNEAQKEIGKLLPFKQKTSYIWSSDFAKIENQDLLKVLEEHSIGRILLSPGKETLKAKDFLKQAEKYGIKVSYLLGENSYVKENNKESLLLTKLSEIRALGFKSIDLDIEPQQFDDFKSHREMYVERLNKIYTAAGGWAKKNEMELSASIPLYTKNSTAQVLNKLNIHAHIMAYGRPENQKRFLERTKRLRETLGDKFTWVIRIKDFDSQKQLNYTLQELTNSKINKIGLYPFSEILN